MNIAAAQHLEAGALVRCPTDRGDPAYVGRVVSVGKASAKNIFGQEYLWIMVRHPRGHATVWPSNRLI